MAIQILQSRAFGVHSPPTPVAPRHKPHAVFSHDTDDLGAERIVAR
jgi:hypothetical protein